MLNRITVAVVLIVCFAILSGCWQMRQRQNRDNLLKLEIGMSKSQVLEIMGQPDLNEAYQRPAGMVLVALFYFANRTRADGNITRDECTPVVLQDDSVIGWGQDFLQRTVNIDVRVKQE